jgi:2-polyprenyl-3-methyl-5-hydroxy-6-metoxy-1,4-benzoquinol methylase
MSVTSSAGYKEKGIVVGNTYDKYGSRNPIVNWIMRKFHVTISDFIIKANPETIHEVGCGEGYWVIEWYKQGFKARGSDFSSHVISTAQRNAQEQGLSPKLFKTRSIHDLIPNQDSANLIVCCEVLEHLENPETALQRLNSVLDKHLILSVPREPLWRILNMMRGKYLASAGNTPGHIQHWSRSEFVNLVSKFFDIVEIQCPLPWTMLLCRRRNSN